MNLAQPSAEPDVGLRQARLARRVTYGLVAVLLLAAIAQVEIWPITAFRLFSDVRTGNRTGLELVATDHDGASESIRVDRSNPVLVTTGRQYANLVDQPVDTQRRMVTAWLVASGVDPASIDHVQLDRVTRELDPDTDKWSETGRRLVVEVDL